MVITLFKYTVDLYCTFFVSDVVFIITKYVYSLERFLTYTGYIT
jgi:hypothetical protein